MAIEFGSSVKEKAISMKKAAANKASAAYNSIPSFETVCNKIEVKDIHDTVYDNIHAIPRTINNVAKMASTAKDIIISGVKYTYDNTYLFTPPPPLVYSKHDQDGYDADSKRLTVTIDMRGMPGREFDTVWGFEGPEFLAELPARIKASFEPTPLQREIWAGERRRGEAMDREAWDRVQRDWNTVKSTFNRIVGEPRTEEAPSLGAHEKYKMMKGW
jgi:hypothetical protein